jgi:hypothetical protein
MSEVPKATAAEKRKAYVNALLAERASMVERNKGKHEGEKDERIADIDAELDKFSEAPKGKARETAKA